MLKFDEQKQLDSVNGALALRGRIEEIVDAIWSPWCWWGSIAAGRAGAPAPTSSTWAAANWVPSSPP